MTDPPLQCARLRRMSGSIQGDVPLAFLFRDAKVSRDASKCTQHYSWSQLKLRQLYSRVQVNPISRKTKCAEGTVELIERLSRLSGVNWRAPSRPTRREPVVATCSFSPNHRHTSK